MFNAAELIERIYAGESSGLGFETVKVTGDKIKSPKPDALSDDIAAFANQSGGVILFGVDDSRQIVGVPYSGLGSLNNLISEICRDSINPPVTDFFVDSVSMDDEKGDGKIVVYLQIDKSLWLHGSGDGYYYRHGNSIRKMSVEQIARRVQARSRTGIVPFDGQLVPNTHLESLHRDHYRRFIPEQSDNDAEWLIKRRLLVKDGDGYCATVAGILMCNDAPDDYYLYNSFIQAVYYNSKEKDANYQIDAKDFKGTLDCQIIDAFKFVQKYNKVSAVKDAGRVDKPQYSMKAVFEALVNAVVHRDYSIHGSKIRLFMFSDRLELHVPGALANTMTVEALPYSQATRNELLSRLLSETVLTDDMIRMVARKYFLERRGEGVGIILRESEQLSGKKPVYEMIGEELKLTIFAAESLQKC